MENEVSRKEYDRKRYEANREKRKEMNKVWMAQNKDRFRVTRKKWEEENVGRMMFGKRKHKLKMKYGLTPEQWDEMYKAQDGLCKICKNPPPQGKRLHVDHDHATKVVRGLLCPTCNMGVGSFLDNPERLREAAQYLENAKQQPRLLVRGVA